MRIEGPSNGVSYREYLRRKQREDNSLFRLSTLARSIGGRMREYPAAGTLLVLAGILAAAQGIKIIHDYQNYTNEAPMEIGNDKFMPAVPKEIKTSRDDYQSLRDYLDNVLSGMPIGENMQSIVSLLPEDKFNYQIDLGLSVGVGEVISEDGVVNRWLPVVTPETELPRSTWKQKGEFITDGVFFVTMFEWRRDGSVLVTRAIARQTSKGWEFNAVKHNKNGVQEELIRFPGPLLPAQ